MLKNLSKYMKAINNLEASNGCEFSDIQVTKNFMFLRQD